MKRFPIVRRKISEKMYKEICRNVPVVCADLAVSDGKKFLLVRRANEPEAGEWWFPGGRVLKNELLNEAAFRLLKAETGLQGISADCLGSYEYFDSPGYYPGINAHTITFVFKVKPVGRSKIFLDKQSSDAKWFSEISPDLHPYIRKFLKKAGLR